MSGKIVGSVPTRQHSCRDGCFSDLKRTTSSGPQRVGAGERHIRRLEEFKRGQCINLTPKFCLPPVQNFKLCKLLPIKVSWRRLKNQKRIREAILLRKQPDSCKPWPPKVFLVRIQKDMAAILVENVFRTEFCEDQAFSDGEEHLKVSCQPRT